MGKRKNHKAKWSPLETFITFIWGIYKEAQMEIPSEFYPEDEVPKIVDALRAQGMGIDLHGTPAIGVGIRRTEC